MFIYVLRSGTRMVAIMEDRLPMAAITAATTAVTVATTVVAVAV